MTTTPAADPPEDGDPDATDTGILPPTDGGAMHLVWSAISDVGSVRKDNQDSGYAGPWLLAVCDGVGGAARGDIASSTAVSQIRRLDEPPGQDVLGLVAGALNRARDRIGELVDEDPALNGTSTTAVVGLFDGHRIGFAHVGDSRAYLLRRGEMKQLTTDHTFVQSLIDEGRISPDEARSHPHRNLILKALDAVQDPEPDLFTVDLVPGDRILVCSDGVLALEDGHIAGTLGSGTPDYAAVELVRQSLDAGSTDNVTVVVADVVEDPAAVPDGLEPMLVGAAADLPRRGSRGPMSGIFRRHPEPAAAELPDDLPKDVHAIPSDPIDPEEARYAPRAPQRYRWVRRLLVACLLVGLVWVAVAGAWAWSQRQFYVGVEDGQVTVFRGIDASLPGMDLSQPYETYDVELDRLPEFEAGKVRDGIAADDLGDARRTVEELALRESASEGDGDSGDGGSPSPTPSPTPSDSASPSGGNA